MRGSKSKSDLPSKVDGVVKRDGPSKSNESTVAWVKSLKWRVLSDDQQEWNRRKWDIYIRKDMHRRWSDAFVQKQS